MWSIVKPSIHPSRGGTKSAVGVFSVTPCGTSGVVNNKALASLASRFPFGSRQPIIVVLAEHFCSNNTFGSASERIRQRFCLLLLKKYQSLKNPKLGRDQSSAGNPKSAQQ
ncbi:hypothetical protein AMECASPLE_031258 [Ameca splendens]|uniref:Uncharacterized protein n=1 Tax=Ameca splendens TaxID=208324 RepID=A0ABV0ZH25_9TELE